MQWIILIGDETFNINSIHRIKHFGENTVSSIENNRFVVDYGKEHIFYEFSESLINDYEFEELQKIPFQSPNFIMMIYKSKELMKKVLSQDNFIKGIYIDDDHGLIMPIEEYIETFSSER
ncbi:hypothetical protein [Saccharibacillus alkalitolerans]|uniref:Uncharacterized protein n=1 Tax=Saccharibacillus alkalitolerans TaxID=2705290 RepID=A0ABX0F9W6_9BACL|nr:hypothetical protein [Saccharibacillus alkalitolerans]NGZ77702.1 hypothetical protein [Saccharibacillus alkalitolerans]